MFLDYKIANSQYSACTESLDIFSPADALHVKYPRSPITIYATKPEVEQYKDRLNFINITEIGEGQAIMEMVRHDSDSHGYIYGKSTACQYRYYDNAHGPTDLVPTTQFQQ